MAQIGILHGNKESFPQAVLEGLNHWQKDCCRFLCVDALHQQEQSRWGWDTPIILDLFSGQMPYLREALHLLVQDSGRVVLNCPKLARLHNRATVRQIAARLECKTAPALLLPARSARSRFPKQGFVNLRYPLAWEEIFAATGPYPTLQALDFDRQPGVTVEDLGALWRRYNETGTYLQELVGAPSSEDLYRIFAIGAERFVRPVEPLTKQLMLTQAPTSAKNRILLEAANAILDRVPWSICSFDLGLRGDQVEYLDSNPDPFLEWWVLGESNFAQAVDGAIAMLKPHLKAPSKPSAAGSKSRKQKGTG